MIGIWIDVQLKYSDLVSIECNYIKNVGKNQLNRFKTTAWWNQLKSNWGLFFSNCYDLKRGPLKIISQTMSSSFFFIHLLIVKTYIWYFLVSRMSFWTNLLTLFWKKYPYSQFLDYFRHSPFPNTKVDSVMIKRKYIYFKVIFASMTSSAEVDCYAEKLFILVFCS